MEKKYGSNETDSPESKDKEDDKLSSALEENPEMASGREVERMFERVFKPGRMNPIVLAPDSPVTHLLQRIRDEAHRFAVDFQRKQRKIF